MEGPCHLLWGLRYSKLGAGLNTGSLTLAQKQPGVQAESEAGKGDEPGTDCEDS